MYVGNVCRKTEVCVERCVERCVCGQHKSCQHYVHHHSSQTPQSTSITTPINTSQHQSNTTVNTYRSRVKCMRQQPIKTTLNKLQPIRGTRKKERRGEAVPLRPHTHHTWLTGGEGWWGGVGWELSVNVEWCTIIVHQCCSSVWVYMFVYVRGVGVVCS